MAIAIAAAAALLLAIGIFYHGSRPDKAYRPSAPEDPAKTRPVEVLVGKTEGDRPAAARHLGINLARSEIDDLYAFLRDPSKNLPALKNEMMNALARQEKQPEGLTSLLIGIYLDPTHDDVTRDYALQHLVVLYSKGNNPDRLEIANVLWEGVGERQGTIPGTALLGLHRLSQKDPALPRARITGAAIQMIENEEFGEPARITALQICGEAGAVEALPLAKRLAEKGETVIVRASAIAAIGRLGGTDEARFLKRSGLANNPRLKPAVEAALNRIKRESRS